MRPIKTKPNPATPPDPILAAGLRRVVRQARKLQGWMRQRGGYRVTSGDLHDLEYHASDALRQRRARKGGQP